MNTMHANRTSATSRRLRRARRAGPLAAALVAAGVIAGCGGSSSGVAGAGSQAGSSASKQQDEGQIVRYAQCMRAHGVTDFPDPTSNGGITLSKTTVESPQFHSASRACRSLAPAGSQNATVSPQVQAQALRFAHCMRSHGVPNFPDPTFTGPGVVGLSSSQPANSPAGRTALQACRSLLGAGGLAPSSGGGS
jgi:hypothetical protein